MLKVPPWHLTVLFELYVHFGSKAAAASSIHNDGPPCVMRHIIQQDNRVDNAINGLSTIIMILIYYINPKKVALIMQFHPLEISFLLKHTSYLNVNTSIQNPKSQSIKAKYLISSFHGHWWKMPNLDLKKVQKTLKLQSNPNAPPTKKNYLNYLLSSQFENKIVNAKCH